MNKTLKRPANNLIPGDVFPVGEYIFDEIEARGMKQIELANALGLSKSEISLIVHGKRNITVPIALKLEKLLGISAEVWMNLQVKFEITTLRKRTNYSLKTKISIAAEPKSKYRKM
jgi:HTH-type transcriptional regulator/antitoxin HigA